MNEDRVERSALTDARTARRPGLPPEVRHVWFTVLLFGVSSILYCLLGRLLFHLSFRSLFPFSSDADRFGDFTVFWQKFNLVHTAAFFTNGFPFSYPAPVALMYDVFLHHAGPHPLVAFVTFSVVAIVVPAIWFGRALSQHGMSGVRAFLFTATLLVFAWPAILVIDRGNMEILVWIALLAATWAYSTGRGYLGAALFGVAASLKLFPFVYLGLFLSTREYRKLLLGAVVFLAMSVAALALLGPSIPAAYAGISGGLGQFRVMYMAQWRPQENGVDHSLFSLAKALMVRVGHHSYYFNRSLSLYLACTAIFGLLLYVLRIRRLPLINQLLAFSIASIFFTAFSGDGTLLHLYYAFGLLLFLSFRAYRDHMTVPGLNAALISLAILVTPLSFVAGRHQRYEGQLRSLLLGYLLFLTLRYGFGPSLEKSVRTREPVFDAVAVPTVAEAYIGGDKKAVVVV